jgi:hypothetical protein
VADKNLRAKVTGLAATPFTHPVSKAARGMAFGAAKGLTGAAVGALRSRAPAGTSTEQSSGTEGDSPAASLGTAQPVGAPAEDTLDSASSADDESTKAPAPAATDDSGPTTTPDVDLLPYPVLDEPVPVVEETLAAEAENGVPVGGHATEPHASTRDEAHGDAQLQRAEQEEIAEEVAEAMPGGDLDLETPVGTTGADVGYNPDTAEADLQQPGTAPGVEPGLASSIRKDEVRGLAAAGGPDETSG